MIRFVVAVVVCAGVLAGCATGPLLSEVMQSKIGGDINDIIRNAGQPATTYRMPNGNLVYVYRFEQFSATPAFAIGWTVIPSETVRQHCSIEFEVGAARIVSVRAVGNACPERL